MPDLCEWWPEQNRPAELHSSDPHDSRKRNDTHVGCQNPAEVLLGADGMCRLCESCAALPNFKRFRSRKRIG